MCNQPELLPQEACFILFLFQNYTFLGLSSKLSDELFFFFLKYFLSSPLQWFYSASQHIFFLICKSKKDIKMKKKVSVHKNDECCFLPRRCYSCRTTSVGPISRVTHELCWKHLFISGAEMLISVRQHLYLPDLKAGLTMAAVLDGPICFPLRTSEKWTSLPQQKKKATVSSIFQSRLLFLSSCAPLSLSVAVKGHLHPSWCYGVLFQRHLW